MVRSSVIIVALITLTALIIQPVYAWLWPWQHPTKIIIYSQIPKESALLNKITITGRLIREDTGQGVPNAEIGMYAKGVYFVSGSLIPCKILSVKTDKNGYFKISWYYIPLTNGNKLDFFLKYEGNSTLGASETQTYTIECNPYLPTDFEANIVVPNILYDKYVEGSYKWSYSKMNVTYAQYKTTTVTASVVGANDYIDMMLVGAGSMFGKSASYGSIGRSILFKPKIDRYYRINLTYKYRLGYVGSVVHALKIADTILSIIDIGEDIGVAALKDTIGIGIKKGFVKVTKEGIKIVDKKKFMSYFADVVSQRLCRYELKRQIKDKIIEALSSIDKNIGKEYITVRIYEIDPNKGELKLIYSKTKDILPPQQEEGEYATFTVKEKEGTITFTPELYLNKNHYYMVLVKVDGIAVSAEYIVNTYMVTILSAGEPILRVNCIKPIESPPQPTPTPSPSKPPRILTVKPSIGDVYVKKGEAKVFEIKVYDPDNRHLSVTWKLDGRVIKESMVSSGSYTSVSVSSARLSYGKHSVTVVVSDGKHEVSHGWDLFVVAPSQPSTTKTNGYECRLVAIYYDKTLKKWNPVQIEIDNHYYKFMVRDLGRSWEGPIVSMEIYKDGNKIYDGNLVCSSKFKYVGDQTYVWDVSYGIAHNVFLNIAVPSDTVKATMPETCYVGDRVIAHIVAPYTPYAENVKVSKVTNGCINHRGVEYSVNVKGRDVYVTLKAPDRPGTYKFAIYDVSNREGFLVFWTLDVKSLLIQQPHDIIRNLRGYEDVNGDMKFNYKDVLVLYKYYTESIFGNDKLKHICIRYFDFDGDNEFTFKDIKALYKRYIENVFRGGGR